MGGAIFIFDITKRPVVVTLTSVAKVVRKERKLHVYDPLHTMEYHREW